MSNKRKPYRPVPILGQRSSDPRDLGGDIAGPGGPRDHNEVVLDTSRGVLLDDTVVAVGHGETAGDFFGMLLSGRVNHSTDRTRVLYMFGGDGLAALITELWSVTHRMQIDPDHNENALLQEFLTCYDQRTLDLRSQGLLP